MNEYTYTTFNIESPSALLDVLHTDVDPDANISGNGHLTIYTTGTQQQVDDVMAKATPGTLSSVKQHKKKDVSDHSDDLQHIGVPSWDADVCVECTTENLDAHQSKLIYYKGHTDKLSADAPYFIFGINGHVASTASVADIEALVDALADRLIYIYTSISNNDGSAGEIGLIGQINAATTIGEVAAVTDTRV